jgi:hypothetical protein
VGRTAVWLAGRGWLVTGVEFSAVGLEKAERLAGSRGVRVEWFLADLLEYEPAPLAYDLVLVFYLQLPAPQRQLVLRRAADGVAPGGTLLVVGHDLLNLTEGYGGPRHAEVLFTPADVVAELDGLQVERAERVRRPITLDGEGVEAIDALVRARRPLPEKGAASGPVEIGQSSPAEPDDPGDYANEDVVVGESSCAYEGVVEASSRRRPLRRAGSCARAPRHGRVASLSGRAAGCRATFEADPAPYAFR